MQHRQMKVSSVSIGLSQKPALAEPGLELGQRLFTGLTHLAQLGPEASERSIKELLLVLFVPSNLHLEADGKIQSMVFFGWLHCYSQEQILLPEACSFLGGKVGVL